MPDDRPGLDQELAELARHAPDRMASRLENMPIREQVEVALRVPPSTRLELLLHAPKPMRLVRSLPDLELYLTVREVGPTDALPLVALASAPQLEHVLDLESWRKDRFDAPRSGAWVALLLEAGEPALLRFLRRADDELLVMLLQRWARVRQIDIDDTPDRAGAGETESGTEAGFLSPDGYHRFSPVIPEHIPAVRRLAELLARDAPERYQRLMFAALWEVPAEVEEQALHWRQSRLEEHGFPTPEEALDIYAPPAGVREHPDPPPDDDPVGPPRAPLRLADARHPLALAVGRLTGERRERTLHELTALANRILVADGADTGEPEHHARAMRKALGYVGIALQSRQATSAEGAARAVQDVPLLELFREGHDMAAGLGRLVRQLQREGWASAHPRALDLLDAPLRAMLAGLLQARPLFFDAGAGADEQAFRDFANLKEIEEAATAVRMAQVVGRVMVEVLGLDVAAALEAEHATPLGAPRFGTLLLTATAWHSLDGILSSAPLPAEQLSRFLRTVASQRTAAPDAAARAMDRLVGELANTATLDATELALLRGFGRASLEILAEECGGLDPGQPVDPRAVSCLLVDQSSLFRR